jgi:Ala-tRNA(Pro) deacylase
MELTSVEQARYPILQELHTAGVRFTFFEHPPVFTVEEGLELLAHIPGQGTKNLFVTDKKKQRLALVTVCEEKRVDLKQLGEQIGFGRLSFGSADRLRQCLGVEPGSVSPLAILFHGSQHVDCFVDADLFIADQIQIHPLRNTATIVVSPQELYLQFFNSRGISVQQLQIPCI